MATFNWTSQANGSTIGSFNPNSDVLVFNDTSIDPAEVAISLSETGVNNGVVTFTVAGKSVSITRSAGDGVRITDLTTSNVTFASGAILAVGDNAVGGNDAGNNFLGASNNATSGDQLRGNLGNDTLQGNAGPDLLFGETGNDSLLGNAGFDTLDGGTGADTMDGGASQDRYRIDNAGDVVLAADGGTDVIELSISYTITSASATDGINDNWRLVGSTNLSVIGGAGDDDIEGNTGSNTLAGGGGDDFLQGGAGNDSLSGGDDDDILDDLIRENLGNGNDTLAGGRGNDLYHVRDAGDVVIETIVAAGGSDTLISNAASYVLADDARIESIRLANQNADLLPAPPNALNFTASAIGQTITGNERNNLIDGAGGNDTIVGIGSDGIIDTDFSGDPIDGADTFLGGAGDDSLYGKSGNDSLDGGADADTLAGGGGNDTLQGGLGDDLLVIGNAGATGLLSGGEDSNSMVGGAGADTIRGATAFVGNSDVTGRAQFSGFARPDTLVGGEGGDLYILDHPDDVVVETGSGGIDTLVAYYGQSVDLGALPGMENLSVSAGIITDPPVSGIGNALFNVIRGVHAVIEGRDGNDTLLGGANVPGQIVSEIGTQASTMLGGAGDDSIQGGLAEPFFTTAPNGQLIGAIDSIDGGAGSDTLDGGAFGDIIHGGSEGDLIRGGAISTNGFTSSLDVDILFGDGGNDTIIGGPRTDSIDGGDGNDTIQGDADTVTGGADTITGGAGNDTAGGGPGNDLLLADPGANAFDGGAGIDTISAAALVGLSVIIDLSANFVGADAASTVVNVENATGGAGNDVITGDGGANSLNGGDGADSVAGGGGNDTIDGGVGNDTMTGGAGADTFFLDVPTDVVTDADASDTTVRAFSGTMRPTLGNVRLAGEGDIDSFGNDLDNRAEGNDGANLITGAGGNDTLLGKGGADELRGDWGDDSANGGADDDHLYGGEGADTMLGGAGGDAIMGDAGKDRLYGEGGNDFISGGLDQDQMAGGAGDDVFAFSLAHPDSVLGRHDRIADWDAGDRIAFVFGTLPLNFVGLAGFTANLGVALPNGGDGKIDIGYRYSGDNTHIAADANDNGVLDASDTFIVLAGRQVLTADDFFAL